ncbi:MAG TPA: M1 family metallopeptidase [Pyrinomonadaceae bacterium]|nr:M1 family metallopeptidase [Pyrinomonadaceae bacterium]
MSINPKILPRILLFLTVVLIGAPFLYGQANDKDAVKHYDVSLQLDIARKTLKGFMVITLGPEIADKSEFFELDCGDLTITSVKTGDQLLKFSVTNHRVQIALPQSFRAGKSRLISVDYTGAPRRGIRFFPDHMQVYTVFSTSQWMPCLDDPNERATLRLKLIVPSELVTVGNGKFQQRRKTSSTTIEDEWWQTIPVPSYTYGFAVGRFHSVSERHNSTELRYVAEQFTTRQLLQIFRDSADMMQFFEEKSGVKYPGASYTQVLATGGVEQEMAGFTALRERYGNDVLVNERDVWLGAHEMAHQWWGIGVGCEAWTHFWLNEGIATFMADAYKEHRFGHEEYLKEIGESIKLYEKVRDAGKDKSLVFADWLHPTAEDRSLVYDKGAYVLHLLRGEMGEPAFWAGLRAYTTKYFGKSVVTADFEQAMQAATSRDLKPFFRKWVYLSV